MQGLTFDEPDSSGGQRIDPKDVVNHLLLVWAIEYIEHSPTQFTLPGKKSDVVVVDAVDLDQVDPDTGQPGLLARKCWWRQSRVIGSLRRKVGSPNPVIARMVRGPATKGQPPFELMSMKDDPQCVMRANAWFQMNPDFKPTPMGVDQYPIAEQIQVPETQLEKMARLAQEQRAPNKEALYNVPPGGLINPPPRPPMPENPPF